LQLHRTASGRNKLARAHHKALIGNRERRLGGFPIFENRICVSAITSSRSGECRYLVAVMRQEHFAIEVANVVRDWQ
jgi:hypothetical protein